MSSLINAFADYKMLSLHCERLADIVLEPTEAEVTHARGIAQLVPRIELGECRLPLQRQRPLGAA